MRPIEIVKEAQHKKLIDEDGQAIDLALLPPLTATELEDFAASLPCPLPGEMAELLKYCRGFEGTLELVDFTGQSLMAEFREIFPHGVPIAGDGFGNFWVVDLQPNSTGWAPIYYLSHDPPTIVYQTDSLAHFLAELFRMFPPHASEIDAVHEDRLADIWRTNPGVLSYEVCLKSTDPDLAAFARELNDSYQIIDLRQPKIGDGFSWGRYGPKTVVKRFGYQPIFAYQKKNFLRRLLGH